MSYEYIRVERVGPVMIIGINRPNKANAFNIATFRELSLAYAELDDDESIRVGVIHGVGRHFTGGMDLREVAPLVQSGESLVATGGIDPWQVSGRKLRKPVIAAVHGKCLTLGVELILATDVVVCTSTASFATLEPSLGLFPFGGGTIRLPQRAGWGNAMRWLLTADEYDAQEAYRIGVVQEIVDEGDHLTRAMQIAEKIARQAPLAISGVLQNARRAVREGEAAAEIEMLLRARDSFTSVDGQAGIASFREPGGPVTFVGR
ncbi:crotonase/enoyl-CoA hydratase family protein [Microbacterium karelineae]|uniref:crotonase/enoyl-CoA hydratase family protein n=1 Tax=Microbacterium karelineae TaxID=2654283 RepID=UPI0012EA8519|nr:crotonase/enoyl-CoA hydratase family protein [Microbacterium karelineae]